MNSEIKIEKKISAANDELAAACLKLLDEKKIYCVNIMGAPGSGKTTFIEGLADCLGASRLAVIQGDLESEIDKERLEARGVHTYQINTHSGCHLNAKLVSDALAKLDLTAKTFLLIENVGNLVCPAGKRIGQHLNLVVSSTTEGSDKPRKYPLIFLDSELVVISKSDLAGAVDFKRADYLRDLNQINNQLQIFEVTSRQPDSFGPVAQFLLKKRALKGWD